MKTFIIGVALASVLMLSGCGTFPDNSAVSSSGVGKVNAVVKADADGMTVEQRNVKERLEEDNKVGSIKHLYVISPYSGQVIIYSTVRGKVTSGGKRLTPATVATGSGTATYGFTVDISGNNKETGEVLGDDGTYGHSGDYVYWKDTRGVYHQHFLTGGQIIHVSSQPLAVKSVILNMETVK